jgi:hypothetical protein
MIKLFLILSSCLFFLGAKPSARDKLFSGSYTKTSIAPLLLDVQIQDQVFKKRLEVKPTQEKIALLPNRIYLVFHEGKKRWYQVLTDAGGDIPSPLEVIRAGSIVQGEVLGAKDPKQRYLSTVEGKWVPTQKKEVQGFGFPEDNGHIKTVEYFTAPKLIPQKKTNLPLNKNPKLFDLKTGKLIPNTGEPLLAERVYLFYSKEQQGWFFVLTDKKGKLPSPSEMLFPGTVLPGKFLGAENPYQNFLLSGQFQWIGSKKRIEYLLRVMESTKEAYFKKIKIITYYGPPH